MEVLRARRYAFHSQRGVALRLTRPDPNNRFKETNRPRRILLVPITEKVMDQILTYASDLNEAADQIEAISLGHQLTPQFRNAGSAGGAPQPSMEQLATLVDNKVSAAITEKNREIEFLKKELLEAKAKAVPAPETPTKRKPGRPKGSKNKPKTLPAQVKKAQEKVAEREKLNEEKQDMLDQALSNAAPPKIEE